MKKTICDHCRKEIASGEVEKYTCQLLSHLYKDTTCEEKDLCGACFAEFAVWFSAAEKKE